jgi:NADP-dependent 3-hydroxy acid dehydrogenase YdfG
MKQWQGKVAFITGASSGIGAALARSLSADGMKVVLLARRQERLDALAMELDASGDSVMPLAVDLRNEVEIREAFARVEKEWGGVDVLVNNAGLGHRSSLIDGDPNHWREMWEVNVQGLLIGTQLAIQSMERRGVLGHVVHISSMAAHRVPPGSGVYSATKFAVRSLTEGLRQELREMGSPIRVTAISPGYVETEFAALYNKSEDAARETYSRYKVLESHDVAEAVRYVLTQPGHVQVHDLLLRPTDQPG